MEAYDKERDRRSMIVVGKVVCFVWKKMKACDKKVNGISMVGVWMVVASCLGKR